MKIIVSLIITLICISVVSFAESIKIKFWHVFSPSSKRGEAINYLIDSFNKKQYKINGKDIVVESVYKGGQGKYSNPYNTLFSELLKATYEKNLPNVSIAYENWVSQFVEAQVLRDFNSFQSKEIERYYNNLYPEFKNSCVIDGKIYSLSFNKSIFVFYYNSKMVDNLPTDFDKFVVKLREIKQNIGKPPLYLEYNEDSFIIFYLLTTSNKFFEINSKIYPSFLGSNLDKVTNLLTNLENEGLIQWTSNSYKDFIENRAPVILATTSKYTDLKSKSQEYVISPLPADNGKIYAAGTNLVLFKSSNEQEEASLKFIEYLIKPENIEYFCINTGYVVPTEGESESYKEFLNSHPDYKRVIEYSKDRLYVQQPIWAWENIRYFINDYVVSTFVNKEDVSNSKKELEQKVNQIMLNQNMKFYR